MSAPGTGKSNAIAATRAEAESEALEQTSQGPAGAQNPIAQAAITTLTWGFRAGAALLALGLLVALIRGEPLSEQTDPFTEVIPKILDGHAAGIVDLAILTLMATPVVTTLVVALAFFSSGDRRYGVITLIVLAVLGISISLSLIR
ncbi:MAG TPA: DUF1634 domain-containing protein [Thermomicrobiales bacterium]